jgi:hypothetical protein
MIIDALLTGAIAMAFAVAGLFFLRFWRETHDRLFAFFALSFFILAVNRIALGYLVYHELYWVRFTAFVLVLLAILDKNRARSRPISQERSGPF